VPSNRSTTASGVTVKASKANDEEGDTWQWDADMLADFPQLEKLSREDMNQVFKALRHGLVQGWKKRIQNKSLEFLREQYGKDWYLKRNDNSELKKDAAAIADALSHIYKCTWWEWNAGSTLFFWRWHPEFKKETRDGIPIYLTGKPPRSIGSHSPSPLPQRKLYRSSQTL
jgi:hypothetical protein